MTFLSLFLKIFSGFKATVVSSFSIVDDIRFNTYTRSKSTIKTKLERENGKPADNVKEILSTFQNGI